MPGKPMLPEHKAWVGTLIDQYGTARLIRLIKNKMPVASRPAGRPADPRGNLLAVYRYVEFHRNQKTPGGRKVGIDGACARLKKISDNYIVDFAVTKDRLRGMYYEAIRIIPAKDLAAATALPYSDKVLPLLLKWKADGSLVSPTIDRQGRGGR